MDISIKFKLRYVLNSREDFNNIARLHERGLFPKFHDYDRAAKFYQLIRYSYASSLDSFASHPHSMWNDFPQIDMASRRLQKIVIENKDFESLIKQYDRPVSFFTVIRHIMRRKAITKMWDSQKTITSG